MMMMMIVMMITGIMNFDDDGHDEDDVEEDTYAGHMFQALKPCWQCRQKGNNEASSHPPHQHSMVLSKKW